MAPSKYDLCNILCHYKHLTPSKSMPQQNNHDLKEKCPYIHAGTMEPMRIKDILIKTVFLPCASVLNTSKAHNDIKFGKEVKTNMVVETSLHSLKGSSDVSTTMSIFISLPNFKSLCVLLIF